MPNLTMLALFAGLLITAATGREALYGDTLNLQINVPALVQAKGFGQPEAEAAFSEEAARIVGAPSILPAPVLRFDPDPTALAEFTRPLSLEGMVTAVQRQFGIDRLGVTGTITAGEGDPEKPAAATPHALDMLLVVSQPDREPARVRLSQLDGDPAALVRQAVAWSLERIAPYRVALEYFRAGLQGDPQGTGLARQTALRLLVHPWPRGRESERAMLLNLLALLDAGDNDLAGALTAYRAIGQLSGVPPEVGAELALNHAIVALAAKQPGDAAILLHQAGSIGERSERPGFAAELDLTGGLIAWGNGDPETAESIFRGVAAQAPEDEAVHHYLGAVLAARGDRDGSGREFAAAQAAHAAGPPPRELALALFWVDPAGGGLTRRY